MAFLIPFINLYIPFEKLNINFLGFNKAFAIPLVDLFGIALFVCFLINFLKKKFYELEKEDGNMKIQFPAIITFLFFFSTSLLSAVNAYSWFGSVWYSIRWILVFYLIYIILPVNIIKSKRILKNTIFSFVLAGVFVSLMGIASIFYQDLGNEFMRLKPISIFGVYPIGENQKQISEILVVAGMFAAMLFYWAKENIYQRYLFFVLWSIFMVVLLGSFSRAAWLIVFLQIIFLLYKYRLKIKEYQVQLALISVLLLALLAPIVYYMIILQTNAPGLGSNEHRILLNQLAWEGFLRHPILGHGSGDFFHLVDTNIRYQATGASLMDSHGIWQKIASEMGMLGLASFTAFIGAIGSFVYKKYKEITDKFNRELFVYTIIAALSIFLFEWFDTSFYRGKLWFTVGVMLAAAYIFANKEKDKQYENTSN
ncbi:MAG: O-antigen ligase family protein [Patescibacteria group bacterium]